MSDQANNKKKENKELEQVLGVGESSPEGKDISSPEAIAKKEPLEGARREADLKRAESLADEIINSKEADIPKESEGPSMAPQSVKTTATQSDDDASQSEKKYIPGVDVKKLAELPEEEQVKALTEIVMSKGLGKAMATIKSLDNPYLYDLLHDTLVDELYDKLKGPTIK